MKMWIVVCTDLHAGLGLFTSAKEAAGVARYLTETESKDSGCTYMPVQIDVQNAKVMSAKELEKWEGETSKGMKGEGGYGQYL
jgi:hypothetical protein